MTIDEQIAFLRRDILDRIAPFMAHAKQELDPIKFRLMELCAIAKRVVIAEAFMKQVAYGAMQSAEEMVLVDEIEQFEETEVAS